MVSVFGMKRLGLVLFLSTLQVAYGWNSTGHQLVASLALKQLSQQEIAQLIFYNNAYHQGFQPRSLASAAVWLDWIHCSQPDCASFRKYHYIDFPYSVDGSASVPPDKINAVSAIQQAMVALNSKQTSDVEKGLQLRILLHVVGDIHQPMHAVSLFSREFPHGDRGGNAYLLGHNRVAENLHAYWDRGGGSLTRKSLRHRHGISRAVQRLNKKYPCELDKMNLDPSLWARESHELAIKEAYQIEFKQKPTHDYQKRVKQVTEQRLSLAACRLAASIKKALGRS
jgi:hypothetical protein